MARLQKKKQLILGTTAPIRTSISSFHALLLTTTPNTHTHTHTSYTFLSSLLPQSCFSPLPPPQHHQYQNGKVEGSGKQEKQHNNKKVPTMTSNTFIRIVRSIHNMFWSNCVLFRLFWDWNGERREKQGKRKKKRRMRGVVNLTSSLVACWVCLCACVCLVKNVNGLFECCGCVGRVVWLIRSLGMMLGEGGRWREKQKRDEEGRNVWRIGLLVNVKCLQHCLWRRLGDINTDVLVGLVGFNK